MAKSKAADPPALKPKIFTSADEISQAILKVRARIHQVEELKKDGLPYRDALRVTAEYQVRDTIRDVFGEDSPEYNEHQHLKIKINSKAAIGETVSLLQHMVVSLEEQRLELLGLRVRPHTKKPSVNDAAADPPTGRAETPPKPEAAPAAAVPTEEPPPAPATPPSAPASIPDPLEAIPQGDTAPRALSVMTTKLKLSAEAPLVVHDSGPSPATPVVSPPPSTAPSNAARQSEEASMLAALPIVEHMHGRASGEGPVAILRRVCGKFHRVARQLRQRREDRPTLEVEDERDMADLLQVLLSLEFDDIQMEDWTPPYGEGASRTDLLLKDEQIVVIPKKTRPGLGAKALTQQVSADCERYAAQHDCKVLFCFIYDPEGRIGNPQGLEGDLTVADKGRRVEVLIAPK